MIRYAFVFFVVMLGTGFLGFTDTRAEALGTTKIAIVFASIIAAAIVLLISELRSDRASSDRATSGSAEEKQPLGTPTMHAKELRSSTGRGRAR